MMSSVKPISWRSDSGQHLEGKQKTTFIWFHRFFVVFVKSLSLNVGIIFDVAPSVLKEHFQAHTNADIYSRKHFARKFSRFHAPYNYGMILCPFIVEHQKTFTHEIPAVSPLRGTAGGHSESACWRQILFPCPACRGSVKRQLLMGRHLQGIVSRVSLAPLMRSHQRRFSVPAQTTAFILVSNRRWCSQYILLRISQSQL